MVRDLLDNVLHSGDVVTYIPANPREGLAALVLTVVNGGEAVLGSWQGDGKHWGTLPVINDTVPVILHTEFEKLLKKNGTVTVPLNMMMSGILQGVEQKYMEDYTAMLIKCGATIK
jgi:hypothetical protein